MSLSLVYDISFFARDLRCMVHYGSSLCINALSATEPTNCCLTLKDILFLYFNDLMDALMNAIIIRVLVETPAKALCVAT